LLDVVQYQQLTTQSDEFLERVGETFTRGVRRPQRASDRREHHRSIPNRGQVDETRAVRKRDVVRERGSYGSGETSFTNTAWAKNR
jgi:hypothetical protein